MALQRLRDRSYLATTAGVYLMMAVLFLTHPFGVHHHWPFLLLLSIPLQTWGVLFLIASILAFVGTFKKRSVWQKVALSVAACVAGGLTLVFAWQLALGQIVAIVPTIVWGYITGTHIIMLRYHDPHVINLIQADVDLLKNEIQILKDSRN